MDDDTQATQLYSVPANTNIVRRLSTTHSNYNDDAASQSIDELCFVGSQHNEASRVLAKITLQYVDKPDVECNATVDDLEKGIYIGAYSDADIVIETDDPVLNKAKFRLTLSHRASRSDGFDIIMFTNLSENDVYLNHKDRVSYYQDRVVLDNTCITFTDPTLELHNGSLRPKLQCVIRPLLNTDRFSDRVVPQQLKEEFNLISEAGNGSFATVIKVQEKRTRAIYACKIIKINILSENFLRTAIEREVNVWKNLDHPNIVKFYRYIDFPDTAVYILEFMRGGTLESLYNTTTYITETTRVSYFKQICEGLAYLHRRKVIHRDLKPQNILLTDTVPVVVKIADLGVAKHTEMFESARTVCGTKLYAAPEIFTDTLRNEEGNYNSSADIWSLGLLLVELMHMKCVDITLADNLRTGKADASAISVPEKVRPVVIGTLKMKPSDRMSIVEVLDHQMFNEKLDDRKRKANDTIISSHIDVDIERAMKRTFISQQQETSLCWGKLCLLEDTAYSKEEFALNKSTIFIGDNQTFDVSLPSRYFSDLYCEISRASNIVYFTMISNTICHHNGCPLDQNMPIRLCNGDIIGFTPNKGDEHKPICFKFEEIHHTLTPSFLSSQSLGVNATFHVPDSHSAPSDIVRSNSQEQQSCNEDASQSNVAQRPWGYLRTISDKGKTWNLSMPKVTIGMNCVENRNKNQFITSGADEPLFDLEQEGDRHFITRRSRTYNIKLDLELLEPNVKTPIESESRIVCSYGVPKTSAGKKTPHFLFAYVFLKP